MSEEVGKTLMPGMSHVVQAGDKLVITDSDGQEIEIVGRESDRVMHFLISFSDFYAAKRAGIDGLVIDSLLKKSMDCFDLLPAWVQSEIITRRLDKKLTA